VFFAVDGVGDVVQGPALGHAEGRGDQAWVDPVGEIGKSGLPQHAWGHLGAVEDVGHEVRRARGLVRATVLGNQQVGIVGLDLGSAPQGGLDRVAAQWVQW